MKVVVVDYGAGNLFSVSRAVVNAGTRPLITSNPSYLDDAEAVIVPGVGAAADTMSNLRASGFVEPIREYIASGRPFLGVCVGQQALFDVSEEGGEHECLGILPGRVVRFSNGLKVPHMGWNQLRHRRPDCPLLRDVPDGAHVYFVHSYYAAPADPAIVASAAEYPNPFAAVVWKDNVFATQFHPEKSQQVGLTMLRNFAASAT